MIAYPKATDVQGARYIGTWGNSKIPVIDVPSMHALNQLVGYVKHINAGNGTVLYRGQCDLYKHVNASIVRKEAEIEYHKDRLNQAKRNIMKDNPCLKFFGLKEGDIDGWTMFQELVIEAILQHYGSKTYCVDFVDNHWTALWFGLNKWDESAKKYIARNNSGCSEFDKEIILSEEMKRKEYPEEPRLDTIELAEAKIQELTDDASHGTITLEELIQRNKRAKLKGEIRQWQKECQNVDRYNKAIEDLEKRDSLYLFLYVAETDVSNLHGLYISENTFTMDLRKLLPSTFLRPCSQHGWIVKGKREDYDFNMNISCVIRVGVELAREMLGEGKLLTQENFFPDEAIDQGYRILLERQENSRAESKHKKLLPPNMITDFGKL